jgi:hypothetical protein
MTSSTSSWNTAIMGGQRENDGAVAAGFLEAADVLAQHWDENRPNDRLVLPILALYRHSIELALKDGIRTMAKLRHGLDGPEFLSDVVEDRLSATHSIGRLVEDLCKWLERLDLGPGQQLPVDTIAVLKSLHLLDENGQAFRYSTVKVGNGRARKLVPARPDQVLFDLPAVAATLSEAASLLIYGVSGVLDQYADWQAEMWAEYGDDG